MKNSIEWKTCLLEWALLPIVGLLLAISFISAASSALETESQWREARYCDLYGAEINDYYGEDYCYVAE